MSNPSPNVDSALPSPLRRGRLILGMVLVAAVGASAAVGPNVRSPTSRGAWQPVSWVAESSGHSPTVRHVAQQTLSSPAGIPLPTLSPPMIAPPDLTSPRVPLPEVSPPAPSPAPTVAPLDLAPPQRSPTRRGPPPATVDVPQPALQHSPTVARPIGQSSDQCATCDPNASAGTFNYQSRPLRAVDCSTGQCQIADWNAARPMDFQPFGQGEYAGHYRGPHVNEYRLRVDDVLEFVFRITRDEQSRPYELNVGDEIRVESFTDATLNRDLMIQPDGTITLRLVGQVKATRHTVAQLREEIEELYQRYYKEPAITVTPLKVNTKLEDLRAAVDRRMGFGGQSREARVTPEGTVALPAIGSVYVQGLTLDEVKQEIDARYAEQVEGLEVTPVLTHRAPRYVFVVGEVRLPGRFTLEGPTTVMQAITLAGGWNVGGNLRQVVVFRRGDDWRLMATMLDLRGALYGKTPCPADEIWLNDSDIVVVPKAPIRVFDDYVRLIFTEGLYHIAPFATSVNFSFLNTLTPAAAAGS